MNFYKKNCCLHFLSIILTYINIHLFKVNHFVISELTQHVSKCKKCDKRFAKKVAELEIKLVLDFHIYRSSCLEVFCRKDVLEISQNSQENTCARDYFSIKLKGLHVY